MLAGFREGSQGRQMTDRRSHLYQQDNVTNWALTIDKALDHVTILKISTQLVFSQPFDTDFEPVPNLRMRNLERWSPRPVAFSCSTSLLCHH